MSKDIQDVKSLIETRKAERKLERKNKLKRILKIVLIHLLIVSFIFVFYITQSYVFKNLEIKGNTNLSKSYIENKLEINSNSLLNFGPLILKEIEIDPMIKTINLNASNLLEMTLNIEEYEVVATLEDAKSWVIENGQVIQGDHGINDVPVLYDFSGDSLIELATTLASLDHKTLLYMSQIIRNPQSYDENYTKVFMQGGIQVNTSFNGYAILDQYEAILKALNPLHQCLSIDEYTLVPYSYPCTLESE